MIREKLKQKMLADERLRVPIYQELPFWLDQDCHEMVELVNDTGSVASLLFEPEGTLIQQRLGFMPHEHDRNEVSFLVEGFNRLYQMTAEELAAMELSDGCYAEAAYPMDACFLEWLIKNALS